jgi:hypothetical protein
MDRDWDRTVRPGARTVAVPPGFRYSSALPAALRILRCRGFAVGCGGRRLLADQQVRVSNFARRVFHISIIDLAHVVVAT